VEEITMRKPKMVALRLSKHRLEIEEIVKTVNIVGITSSIPQIRKRRGFSIALTT
jgi:hypothetical protein